MSRRVRQIMITPVLNGFIAEVGCQRVVFESRGKLLEELRRYLNDPCEVEKVYISQAVNPMENTVAGEIAPTPSTGESLGSLRYPTGGVNPRP